MCTRTICIRYIQTVVHKKKQALGATHAHGANDVLSAWRIDSMNLSQQSASKRFPQASQKHVTIKIKSESMSESKIEEPGHDREQEKRVQFHIYS